MSRPVRARSSAAFSDVGSILSCSVGERSVTLVPTIFQFPSSRVGNSATE
jgi:hypothetical protein